MINLLSKYMDIAWSYIHVHLVCIWNFKKKIFYRPKRLFQQERDSI